MASSNEKKLVVIIGITGNQGGTVANAFLKRPEYRIRGLTRNTESEAAKGIADKGIEIVQADLDDVKSLEKAFEGANLIFSVTNYWEPFFRPDCRIKAKEEGKGCRKFAYEIEYRQGKNIADAATKVASGLDDNGLIASTLSHAGKCSKGKYKELYHFDAKADIFPDYVEAIHPALASKSSYVQTGYFTSSYKLAPKSYLKKLPSGTYQMSFPTLPEKPVPHLFVTKDLGPFISAVSKMPPGNHYMAAGTTCSWTSYMATWSSVTGKKAQYKQCTLEEFVKDNQDEMFGWEAGDMFLYSGEPGYDGGCKLFGKEELKEAGFECPMTSLREWMEREDWGAILEQDVDGYDATHMLEKRKY